jgi:large subunit ribosomal protein L17
MRHAKHRHGLGVKKEHRKALISSLASALLEHGQIETTLAKAKALRPFVEKIITLAKKAAATDDKAKKLHYRRLAYAKMNNSKAPIDLLFEEKAVEFTNRNGGYTRIYKLVPRISDAADMALIELINASDEGYKKRKAPKKKAKKKTGAAKKASSEDAEVAIDEPKSSEDKEGK